MSKQRFVNLMPHKGLTRNEAVLKNITVHPHVTPEVDIRIFPNYEDKTIYIVPEDMYVELDGEVNPFDDWTLTDEDSDVIIWIATEKLGFISTIASTVRVLRIDGGYLVALIKGKIGVTNPAVSGDEILELSRKYGGEAEVDFVEESKFFTGFQTEKTREGVVLPNYSWNVILDITIKQYVYGKKYQDGFRYKDTNISGIDFRPTDYYKLDNGYYDQLVAEHKAEEERKKREEEIRRIADEAEAAMREIERREKEQEKAAKKASRAQKQNELRDGSEEFLRMVGLG